jgi:Spy/CpxP family protein refolding chaperone
MNRRMSIVVATVAAFALGAATLLAQGPGGAFRGGPGGPGGRGGGPPGILPGLNRLDLTDAQREQVRAIMEAGRQAGDPGEKVGEAERALNAALLADTANPQAIENARAALNAAHAASVDRRIELMQKIVQVLTPAQRQELAKMPGPGGREGRGRHLH